MRMDPCDPRRAGGRLILAGFHGTAPPAELEVAIVRGVIGGVIYFARNIVAPDQVAEMSARLQAIAPWPLFIAIDQEGGSVQRLRAPFVELPPMAALGARGDAGLAERVGRLLGRELRTVGVNWDFAPVLDVDTNPANPVIGKRSFGRDPALVAALGVALARGLEGEGIVSCGKHFPGHGDTHQDSHHTLPTLPHGLERLREIELPPFAAYGRAGLASIMTAHVLFPALDASLPATLSPSILRLLRDELSFDGLIVSDDLEMKAVSEQYAVEALVTRGVAAGIDVFLVCSDFEGALRASRRVRDLARDSPAACASIERSLRRLDALCTRFGLPHEIPAPAERASILGCEAHRRVLEEILAQKTGVD